MDWSKLFALIMGVEEKIVPLFVHNPKSQQIAGVIMAAESSVPSIIASVQAAAAPASPAPAAPAPVLPQQ